MDGKKGGGFWPAGVADGSETASSLGGAEMCSVDVGLTEALRLGREVLFAAESGSVFVAVSSSEDEQLPQRHAGRQPTGRGRPTAR